MHNLSLRDHFWLMEMLNNSYSVRCGGILRLQEHVFLDCIVQWKREFVESSRYVNVEEQVVM